MHVDVIDDAERLAALKQDWEAVYDADPDAQYFLSWPWMSKWLNDVVSDAVVLAARPDSDSGGDSAYVAFLPIRLQTGGLDGGGVCTVVKMAGQGVADYTGLLCRPDMEEQAIKAIAHHVKKLGWRSLVFGSFRASDARMRALADHFPGSDYKIKDFDVIYADGTDHSIFPFVALPGDWETYLETRLSKDTRRKVRRFTRQVEETEEFRVTVSNADTLERDLDILFKFWTLKWGSPGTGTYVKLHVEMFRHCAAMGSLFLTVMWQGDRPLGALANLLDDGKQAMLFKIFSRDETFGNPSPGLVLYTYAIRNAIERGYKVCDFLQGNHRFKYSFGAEELRVFQKAVSRRSDRPSSRDLDRSCVPAALHYTHALHQQGRVAEAEQNYRQILRVDPRSAEAAQGLRKLLADPRRQAARPTASAQILEARRLASAGKVTEANTLLTALLRTEPSNFDARYMLGLIRLQQRDFTAAEGEFRLAIRICPDAAFAHNSHGRALVGLGRADQALASFDRAIALKLDFAEAHHNRGNALKALGRFQEALQSFARAGAGVPGAAAAG